MPTRDAWLQYTPDGAVSIDDLTDRPEPLASIERPEADEDARWSVSARLDGDVAWIVSSAPSSQVAWRVHLASGETQRYEVGAYGEPPFGDRWWDVLDGKAVFHPGEGPLVVVDGQAGTRADLLSPADIPGPATIRRGRAGTWFVYSTDDRTVVEYLGDDDTEARWKLDPDISLDDATVDSDCLWVATGVAGGCEPGMAAFRVDEASAVLSETFSAGCISTIDVADGQVVVGTSGGDVSVLDARSGERVRHEDLFACGDGVSVVARDGRTFASDDCDGVLAELSADGVRTWDIATGDPEPSDFVAYFQWPWMVAGSYGNEQLHLLSGQDGSPVPVPTSATLLIPV